METIDDYLNLRYNSGEWEQYEDYADSVIKGDLSAFADFELYKIIDEEIEDSLVGIVANGGVKISGKSAHFTNQVIGSIYTGKSGVEIENIQKALQTEPVTNKKILRYKLNNICVVNIEKETGKLVSVKSLY